MADPFNAKAYGEHLTATTGQTISAADFVAQPYVGSSEKVRNLPIDPQLETLLAQIANETGVTFVVSSGGQTEAGRKKLGSSTRHNDGKAADVMAKDANGNWIDFSTPDGQQTWSRVVQLARAGGATGIGAGPNYMGTKTVHIGYGSPAVWSSVKSGQPVEKWLQTAYNAGKTTPPLNIPTVASELSTTTARSPTISKATQDALRQAGFNPGASDGINGLKTQAAVKAFQSANGLQVDGIVGKNTLAALQRATAASKSAPSPLPSRGVAVAHQSAAQNVPQGPQGRRPAPRAPQASGNGFMGLLNAGRTLGQTFNTLGAAAGSISNAVNPRQQPTPPRVPSSPRRSTPMPAPQQPSGPQGRGRPANAFLRPYGQPAVITVRGGNRAAAPTPRSMSVDMAARRAQEAVVQQEYEARLARVAAAQAAAAPGRGGGEVRYESTGAAGQPIYVAPGQSQQFVDSVTRASNMPGVNAFTGTVQQGEGGQNRYGSTARNELMAQFGF